MRQNHKKTVALLEVAAAKKLAEEKAAEKKVLEQELEDARAAGEKTEEAPRAFHLGICSWPSVLGYD